MMFFGFNIQKEFFYMSHHYDEEIQSAEKQLESAVSRMKDIQKTFMSDAVSYIKSWFLEMTKQKVTGASKLTKQLGMEKLSKMKAEVNHLQDQTPDIINDLINDVNIWWHLKPDDQSVSVFKESISKSLRLAAGKLALILEKYGYITTDPSEPGYWREWDEFGINRPTNPRPYYPYPLDWTPKMRSVIDEYEELARDAIHFRDELKKLKSEKTQYEVNSLWDNA
jgi:hypothetical protein